MADRTHWPRCPACHASLRMRLYGGRMSFWCPTDHSREKAEKVEKVEKVEAS